MQVNAIGSGSNAVLSGLPYPARNTGGPQTGAISYFQSIASVCVFLGFYVENNDSTIQFVGGNSSAVTISRNAFAVFGNGARVIGAITYIGDTI